ncbi:MAG: cytochrome P450 [Burkholderiales bacterium]
MWQLVKLWRQSTIAIWEENAFSYEFISVRFFTRRVFLCNSPETVQFVFSTHHDSFERKTPQLRHSLLPLIGDGLFVSDGETWRQRRRVVAPVIHVSRLPGFAPIMCETAAELRDRWASLPPGAEIDVLNEMAQLTAETICRTLFGRRLGRDNAEQIVSGFSEYQRHIGQLDVASLLGLPDWLPRWHSPRVRKSVRRIHAVLDGIIETMQKSRESNDVSALGQLMDARDPDTGVPLEAQALRNEVAVLFMAGHETTANVLAWTWFLLSQAPDVEERFHAELDSVLGSRQPVLADVQNLPYTRAVIEETMRLYPPVPTMGREALREEKLLGMTVPKASFIVVSPWLLHRHKKIWNKPDHFIPERFLPGGDRPASKFAYIPFSIGPRVCAGMGFALAESILCLALLGRAFKLRLKPGHDVRPVSRLTLRPGDMLPMHLHSRTPPIAQRAAAEPPAFTCPHGHG